jgi:membrane fusion protein, multidrug efflux system
MIILRNKLVKLSALVALLSGATACQEVAKKEAAPLEVQVVRVAPQDVTIFTDFVGSIDGIENADIRARVAGYLEEVHFKEGTRVKKGDLLFTIDPVLSEAQVRRARGDLAMAQAASSKAKADVDRLTPLVATNSVSRQELDHATAERQGADAQIVAAQGALASAQASLDFTKVRSPIDGIVGVRQVSLGTLVGQSEPTLLTTVSQLDPVRVRFPISEQLYLKHAAALNRLVVAPVAAVPGDGQSSPASEGAAKKAPKKPDGTPAEAAPPEAAAAPPGRLMLQLILADGSTYAETGWLALIDRAVSVSTGSILLEARFPNTSGVLRPGQFARVRAATDSLKGALAVPQRAVTERQSMHELWVLGADNKVERRAVTVGERVGRYWLIAKGLSPGDQVLIDGVQKVRPGQVVEPHEVPLGHVSADSAEGAEKDAAATPPSGKAE